MSKRVGLHLFLAGPLFDKTKIFNSQRKMALRAVVGTLAGAVLFVVNGKCMLRSVCLVFDTLL